MGFKFAAAKATGAVLTWGLQNIMHRDGATMPGKYALKVDPDLLTGLAPRLREGSVLVVGTNGKTSVTNLLADVLEAAGKTVCCNRTGANLSWGVASSLMQTKGADWGVFETDELWIARVLPHLKSRYVVLLNLFADQLDRFGEIDRVQESLVATLSSSPETVLIYNADDPMCTAIAQAAPNRSIAFGVAEPMVECGESDSFVQACQQCGAPLEYRVRQYSHLGDFACTGCDFARPELAFVVRDVSIAADGLRFTVVEGATGKSWSVESDQATAYMVYNLMAVSAAAHVLGVDPAVAGRAIDAFNPQNGRLQRFNVRGHSVLLNLAKNPTGLNQNVDIVTRDRGPKVVACFVNDMEGDGRDASWIWDVDFEELAPDEALVAFVGGMRANDLQVCLKYAGVQAEIVENMSQVFDRMASLPEAFANANVYAIANYTALPPIRTELGKMAAAVDAAVGEGAGAGEGDSAVAVDAVAVVSAGAGEGGSAAAAGAGVAMQGAYLPQEDAQPIVVEHWFPALLNAQACAGNVRALEQRCAWRGVPVEVRKVNEAEQAHLDQADVVFVGVGLEREQALADKQLAVLADQLQDFENKGGVVLDLRNGYELRTGGSCAGDLRTGEPCADEPCADEPCASADAADDMQACFEAKLAKQCQGPLLAFSPEAADYVLKVATARYAQRTGEPVPQLEPLDDAAELAACAFMSAQRA